MARRVSAGAEEEAVTQVADESPLPDDVLQDIEEQHLVRAAVAALDERCRVILRLLFYSPEPASYTEIAEAIGVGATSIGPLRARCLKKMARLLRK